MTGQQIILLVINVIGGIAVIGSYIFGLSGQTGAANTLWGGLPTAVRPVYGISMILSALGYFAFIYFILFHVDPAEAAIAGRFGYALFYAIFLVILMPSALWMPLTKAYVAHPNDGLWIAIRAVHRLPSPGRCSASIQRLRQLLTGWRSPAAAISLFIPPF
jgi:hypothetical protein